MTNDPAAERERILSQAEKVVAAVHAAVREALIQHKRAGNPIAVCEDGQVKLIQPEDIEIPEPTQKNGNGLQSE